ncbi:MAG TPA: 4-hydroxythreonine-4-phosphate dehydrogenase PdxA [Chitinophagaceae bacterium]|nr:4-hydroxythreonine-4-phosphate dehydrogenase PdxA [Chitinophagaceae bacterium]
MSAHTHKPIIGITTGDLNGIGLELIIKSLSEHRLLEMFTPVIFASNKSVNYYRNILGEQNLKFFSTKNIHEIQAATINIFNCWDEEVKITPGQMTDIGGKYGIRSLQVATQCLKDKEIEGMVTNPIHKNNSQTEDFKYTGHTPFLKDKFGVNDVAMMMCSSELRIALLTEHLPLSEVSKHITVNAILSKGKIINQSLIKDFGIDKPKIAILALNPHASDGGLIGNEEKDIIVPAIEKLRNENILAFGPYSADAFFARSYEKRFDCVLAMYHDQGLIPFKSLDRGMGVNYTAGLPIIRTSPDHGTAFDIAGKNKADITSFLESIFMCIDILRTRKSYIEHTSNRLQKGLSKSLLKKTKDDIEE